MKNNLSDAKKLIDFCLLIIIFAKKIKGKLFYQTCPTLD